MKINKKNIKADEVDVLLENKQLKQQNEKLVGYIESSLKIIDISKKTKDRIDNCASYLKFLKGTSINLEQGDVKEDRKVMVDGYFCENRFCPVCSKNKARKDALRLNTIMSKLTDEKKQAFLFLTLTVKNCEAQNLISTLDMFNSAFNRLSKYKAYTKAVNGSVRKLEITYNKKMNTYHPHLHILLSVDDNYFTNPHKYIKRDIWLEMWQKATKDNTITQVDVRRANENSVKEMSKYMSKDSDYLHSKTVFSVFYSAMKGRRLITYSGNFKNSLGDYEAGLLDDYRLKEILLAKDYNESDWQKELSDYNNQLCKMTDLSDNQINYIKEKLNARGYALEQKENDFIVKYIGKTTYGNELIDD